MAWPLREISGMDEQFRIAEAEGAKATIGLYWKSDVVQDDGTIKRGVTVVLPPGGAEGWFAPYHLYPNDQRWSVAGEWPNVTITPSINCPGRYHGWITNGMITDDCEGRKF